MNEKVGLFIAELRKNKNLTQKELADKLNITDRAVSKWERGICMPDISLLTEISDILDISISELLNGKNDGKKKVNNKEIINAVQYADNNMKEKTLRIIDFIFIFIIGFSMLIFMFLNIRNVMKFNTKYNSYYTDNGYIIDEVKNRAEMIINNQGKYTKDEYGIILSYVTCLSNSLNYEYDKNTFIKESYTYKDILNYNNNEKVSTLVLNSRDVYKVLIKRNFDKLDSSYLFETYTNSSFANESKLNEFIANSYSYKNDVDKDAGRYMFDMYKDKYIAYKLILNDIIEVGGINE